MPTYGYECTACNEQFEVVQRITEDALTTHAGCGGSLRRLLFPVGIVFKGPGFYVNDYARKSGGSGKSESKSAEGAKPDAPEKKAASETPAAAAAKAE